MNNKKNTSFEIATKNFYELEKSIAIKKNEINEIFAQRKEDKIFDAKDMFEKNIEYEDRLLEQKSKSINLLLTLYKKFLKNDNENYLKLTNTLYVSNSFKINNFNFDAEKEILSIQLFHAQFDFTKEIDFSINRGIAKKI